MVLNRLRIMIMACLILVITACGNEKEETKKEDNKKEEATEEVSAEKKETKDSVAAKGEETAASVSSDILNPAIAEKTEGNVEVLYTNKEPNYSNEMKGLKVNVEEYQIVKVSDINADTAYFFKDQSEGYIVTAKVNINNESGRDLYYNNTHRIQYGTIYETIPGKWRDLVDEKDYLVKRRGEDVGLVKDGEKITGLLNFIMTNEEFKAISNTTPKYIIEGGAADNKRFEGSFGADSPAFDFVIGEQQAEKLAAQPKVFQDKLTSDNMATKKLLYENLKINEANNIDQVNLTLEGIQYAEITPSEATKSMFRNFNESGIIALTMKFKVENKSDQPLNINSISAFLRANDNQMSYMSQPSLEPDQQREPLEPGTTGEILHVFLIEKDLFSITKKLKLEYGPFRGKDGKDLFKGKKAEFTIPLPK